MLGNTKLRFLVPFLALSMVLVPVVAGAASQVPEENRSKLIGILNEEYGKLPGMEYEFGEPSASFEDVTVAANTSLALSEANLSDGLLVGLTIYGEKRYLMLATDLPEGMEEAYAVGLIDLSREETAYVAYAKLVSRSGSDGETNLNLTEEEGTDNLKLEVIGKKYILSTSIPKSL
jgi:hypothetical protein